MKDTPHEGVIMARPPYPVVSPAALAVVRGRRITNRELASALGCSPGWVGEVLLGYVAPPAHFRKELAALLDINEEALFPEPSTAPPTGLGVGAR
jgi:transcriptional regulator with XRE-family HTH domain